MHGFSFGVQINVMLFDSGDVPSQPSILHKDDVVWRPASKSAMAYRDTRISKVKWREVLRVEMSLMWCEVKHDC